MTDREILLEMLRKDALEPKGLERGKPIIKLRQGGKHRYSVTIYQPPSDSLVIKAENFPAPSDFFKGSKGENKRADFIVISEGRRVILYIELKAGKRKPGEIKQQLKGASCVLAYCKEVARQFWNKNDFLDNYDCRYIGIVGVNIRKRRTRPESPFHKPSTRHNSPESFLTIRSPHHLKFNKLAA